MSAPVAQRIGRRKALGNIGWLTLERVLTDAVGLAVGVWVARHLGPSDFGLLMFAVSFAALFTWLPKLGLEAVVVRELARAPEQRDRLLGSAFRLQLLGGAVGAIVMLTIGALAYRDEPVTAALLALAAVILLAESPNTVVFWLKSRVEERAAVLARSIALLAGATARVGLILAGAAVVAFGVVVAAQAAAAGALLLLAYRRRGGSLRAWEAAPETMRSLLRAGWPLALSAIAIGVYMRIDQVMLRELVGDGETGVYAAAVRLSEAWYFVPTVVTGTVFPILVRDREHDPPRYRRRLQALCDVLTWGAIGVGIAGTLLAMPVVRLLYGDAFAAAGPVLALHVWTGVFVAQGTGQNLWYVAEGRERLLPWMYVAAAVANVGLNAWWIPVFGAQGAAAATCVAQALVTLGIPPLVPAARPMTRVLWLAFAWPARALAGLRGTAAR